MPPVPQEPVQPEASASDRVVVSGMSGLYPNSRNVAELSDILYNKVNPVSTDHNRWTYDHPEASPYTGAVPDLGLFDAQFFKVHRRLGDTMDPMARKILEESYKAIYDAGLGLGHLHGKKIGVYVGSCFSETEKVVFYKQITTSGIGIAGGSKTMFANRISYWLNGKGPSHAVDQACCSSTLAIEQAYQAIKRGECDAAIAGGCNVCLHPQNSIHCGRITKVSPCGKTKSYDQNAEGFARSEAIAVVFLQKAQDALRVYGEIVHIKNEFVGVLEGRISPKYGFDRDPIKMANFIKKVYDEAGIPPSVVEYVEGFGSADLEADKSELEALAAVFKREKEEPLLLGSVMSNIGYTEAATGVAAITKVLLGYHKGELAGNLHLDTPRQDVAAVREGRVKVLGDHHKFGRSFAAVNGLSTTGVNSHVLLHGNYKPKDLNRYRSTIPRLVTVSSRTDEGVEKMLETLKGSPVDAEQIALLHNAHSIPISGHLGKGYIVLDTNKEMETVSLAEKADYSDDGKRPLVFVYSGMGSQWAGMGAQLMRIPIFAAAIERCDRVLRPRGIDIAHIITSPEPSMFDNILHSFVGIAAVQIGLTDVLRAVGLEPDFIIGHSVGELGCAYADGCFTAEEMILSAYSRGLVSVQTPFIKGSMAAVGIGYQKIKDMCPAEIEVACHNGPDSCTISGPQDAMKHFVAQLTADQIFAKEVPCSNIAYHSRYIADAGPALRKYLSEVIKSPKERSKRWLSSSVPVDRWDEPEARLSSAEYHTNNLLNSVLFEETSRLLPANGVLVEIAPHGLLQAILKRSLPDPCTHIPMTRRGHKDNALRVLEAIGKLYVAGFEPQVSALYPKVEFPVSTGTPFLSHLVHWMHSERWPLSFYEPAERRKMTSCKFVVSLHDDDNSFLKGNVVRGKTLYPYAAALVAVWDTLAMSMEEKKKGVSVQFTDIHFYAQPILHDRRYLRIHVNLHKGTGMFEVQEEGSLVVTGNIVDKVVPVNRDIIQQIPEYKGKMVKSDEVYQILKKRDYCYSGEFRSIADMSTTYQKANMQWTDNWTTFIDGLLQVYTLNHEYEGVSEPRLFRSLSIDVEEHLKNVLYEDKVALMQADFVQDHEVLCCGGIMLEKVVFRDIPPVSREIDVKAFKLPCFKAEDCNDTQGGEYYRPCSEERSTNSVLSLRSTQLGDLSSLRWVEQPELEGAGIPVTVHYCSFNHRDLKQALGVSKYDDHGSTSYSMEFSGVTNSGERVMGIIPHGAASSRVLAIPELLWPVPEYWSLEEAATVPLAYALAFYCLYVKTTMADSKSIFVHCGAGGLGQAVISVALAHKFRVFTTVSSVEKKQFLLKRFPGLQEKDIGNSRDHTFADLVLTRTEGEGCKIAISCVEGILKNSTFRVCGNNGITFDFSQISNAEDFMFGMYNLTQDRTYHVMEASCLFVNKNIMKIIREYVVNGIIQGHVVPLTRTVFQATEAARALRLLAAGNHRGRVVLHVAGSSLQAQPRIKCSPGQCHLVVTDDYDCGLQWVQRLVDRGANKIRMHSLTTNSSVVTEVTMWQNKGIDLRITCNEDLKTTKGVLSLLDNCVKAGPIEGVYVLSAGDMIRQKTVDHLDVLSRKLCQGLKYFAVISRDRGLGRQTCTSRAQEGLPANKLILSFSKNIGFCNSLLDAIERALRSKESVLIADSSENKEPCLIDQIASIAEMDVRTHDESTTLGSLGLSDVQVKTVSDLIRDVYNVYFPEEKLKSLTIKRLKLLESKVKGSEFQKVNGLQKYFNYIDSDELQAAMDIVYLPTMSSNYTLRADELDLTQTFLCIVPGLEGHNKRFTALCERLKLPALVLQPGLDNLDETVSDTAHRYATTLLVKTKLTSNFYLMGYESGVLIALEMAAILEENGLTGTVYCVGASPEDFKATLEKELSVYRTEDDLQDAVAHYMLTLMGRDTKQLSELKKCHSWDEKIQVYVRSLIGQIPHSTQYAQALIKAAYARIVQVRNHKPKVLSLRSQLVLVRAAEQQGHLQTNSNKPVIEYDLKAPLAHAADDLRCANIINRHLDQQLLDEFHEKNICDSYVTNFNSYIVYKRIL